MSLGDLADRFVEAVQRAQLRYRVALIKFCVVMYALSLGAMGFCSAMGAYRAQAIFGCNAAMFAIGAFSNWLSKESTRTK